LAMCLHGCLICHACLWKLQDEPFAFCGRISTACVDLLNRVFSTLLISFLLRAIKQEQNSTQKIKVLCLS